jgi:hypothetical protein
MKISILLSSVAFTFLIPLNNANCASSNKDLSELSSPMQVTKSIVLIPSGTNPYYLSCNGTAKLKTGRIITGKFYYSMPFLSKKDLFYFYEKNIKTKEIILVTEVSEVKFISESGKEYIYKSEGEGLYRLLSDGKKEKLTTRILRNLE